MRRPIARDINQRKRSPGSLVTNWAKGYPNFDPSSLNGLELWLDASDSSTITATGSPLKVSQWNDKSGNARHVTQATGTAQPSSGVNTQNGLNVLTFDGGDWLQVATASDFTVLHNGTNYIIAGVVQYTNTFNGMWMGNTQNNNGERGFWLYRTSTNNLSHLVDNGNAVNTTVTNNGNMGIGTVVNVITLLADPDNSTAAERSSLYRNNGSAQKNNVGTTAPSTLAPTARLAIGAAASTSVGGNASFGMTGRIAEVVIVAGSDATETNRLKLLNYLNAKWAVF